MWQTKTLGDLKKRSPTIGRPHFFARTPRFLPHTTAGLSLRTLGAFLASKKNVLPQKKKKKTVHPQLRREFCRARQARFLAGASRQKLMQPFFLGPLSRRAGLFSDSSSKRQVRPTPRTRLFRADPVSSDATPREFPGIPAAPRPNAGGNFRPSPD